MAEEDHPHHDRPPVQVHGLRFEHLDHALGVGTPRPRLSWQVTTDDPAWQQTAYEVEPAGTRGLRVTSAEQVLVPWPFEPLRSRERVSVRVRAASRTGWSGWSPPAVVEAGLLDPEDWTASFVSPATLGRRGRPAPLLERSFTVRGRVAAARLYVTAHGVYEVSINGHRVGDEVLAPGWTSYHHRLRYRTHDVTGLLGPGGNTVSAVLGNGWWRGRLGWQGASAVYGDRLALLVQLEITYEDGSRERVGTDERWHARESGVLADDLYDGQRTDLQPRPGTYVEGVEALPTDARVLVAPEGPPVRVTEVVPARRVWTAASGRTLVDFGRNVVGRVRLTVRRTSPGQEVCIRHAEVLEHGELATRPLRSARATDSWLLDAADESVLEPSLTFHGFRYAEITGVPAPDPADVSAVVVGSDLRRTGWFSCSDPDVCRLHDNVVASMRGNFLDVPTDCPQRDERLGWTGDIQVFAPAAAYLHDTAGFLSSWLADLAADQHPDGAVPFVVPDVLGEPRPLAAAWGDAAVVVPWVLYRHYGDTRLLERQFASMRAWVDRVARETVDGVWRGGFQFGDWLDPAAPPDDPFAARTDPDVVATAHLARSAGIVAEAAVVLGRDEDEAACRALARRTREAFVREFTTASGRILSDAVTAYAMALCWDLLPDEARRRGAGQRLADLVALGDFRIATGFVGTPLVCEALTRAGRPRLAHRLLAQRACPSWLYPVTMGATTVWERWDSMLPDGTVNPGEMTSFNHYALGAVADWLHRSVAGLAPAAPGHRELEVRPVPDPSLRHAAARLATPYGEASVAWRHDGTTLRLDVVVPVGCRARVYVPGDDEAVVVRHGRHTWTTDHPFPREPAEPATVRDLIVDAGRWQDTVDMLRRTGIVADGREALRHAAHHLDAPAGDLVPLVTGTAQHTGGPVAHGAGREPQQPPPGGR